MKKIISFSTTLIVFVICLQAYAKEVRTPVYLKPPMVQWDKDRLTGELKKVPVSNLIEDLLKSKYFGCAVEGTMNGTISISFENLTVEEIIRKILRNYNYNYTILSHPGSTDIEKLTIYQGDSVVSFNRVPIGAGNNQTDNIAKKTKPPFLAKTPPPESQLPISDEQYSQQMEELDGEIKEFLDDMLKAKKISKDEYENAIANIKAKANIN